MIFENCTAIEPSLLEHMFFDIVYIIGIGTGFLFALIFKLIDKYLGEVKK